jgi:hypothetical protein
MCLEQSAKGIILKPFRLEDRVMIESHLAAFEPVVSDLNFTAMFMWRNFYKSLFAMVDGFLCIVCGGRDGRPYMLQPVGPGGPEELAGVLSAIRSCFEANGRSLIIRNADPAFCGTARQLKDFDFEISYDRDNCDYVYLTQDLIALKGGKYDAKRNHINKFLNSYDHEVLLFDSGVFDAGLIEECRELAKRWSEDHDCAIDEGILLEYQANVELLKNFGDLDLKGIAVRVDGMIEGYSIGSMLNSNTVVIHSEKANFRIQGIYAYINRVFLEKAWSDTIYVNREEDIGIEGIRKAKLSYNPFRLQEKYVLEAK